MVLDQHPQHQPAVDLELCIDSVVPLKQLLQTLAAVNQTVPGGVTMVSSPPIAQTLQQFDAEIKFCADHSLQLERASDYGWLVRAGADAHVLGCIDQLDDAVELMRLDGGFTWTTFPSLHDALEDLVYS